MNPETGDLSGMQPAATRSGLVEGNQAQTRRLQASRTDVLRIALGIEYDGRDFCGWQTQPSRCALQNHLEAALAQVHGESVQTITAGRTDAGVHAVGQVVHFDAVHYRPEHAWVFGTNSRLPSGMSVLWAKAMPDSFHARFGAIERTYRYVLMNQPVRPALLAGRVGWVHGDLDLELMKQAAPSLLGEQDFSAFRAAECQARSPVRDLRAVAIWRSGACVQFEFRANAFLHHQVRNMVGALVWVGLRRRPPEWIADVLQTRDRTRAAATFAADGLYLADVRYDACYAVPKRSDSGPLDLFPPQP
jgi:tRNA pseudouridine38-40 synthase